MVLFFVRDGELPFLEQGPASVWFVWIITKGARGQTTSNTVGQESGLGPQRAGAKSAKRSGVKCMGQVPVHTLNQQSKPA